MSLAPDAYSGLTTAQLAQRTGVPAATLRMWESRHGFPVPRRLPSGHRRYQEDDVELVREVLRRRGDGLSLVAAIARTISTGTAKPASIFARLAQRRPELQPMILSKGALLKLTRAIEDEHGARAGSGVLIGSFQREQFFRQVERRWRELARTATLAVALADFPAVQGGPGEPMEVPTGSDHPLTREWSIIFHGPLGSACLASWEIPQTEPSPDPERRFEALWSPEPEVALAAVSVAAGLIEDLAPSVGLRLAAATEDQASPTSAELRAAVRQAHRMLAYLGGR